MSKRRLQIIGAVVLGCVPASAGKPEEQARAPWISVTTFAVAPHKRAAFERALHRQIDALKGAGAPWVVTLQTCVGDVLEFTTVVPAARFGDLESAPDFDRASGLRQPSATSLYTAQRREVASPLPGLGIGDADPLGGRYWVETRVSTLSGKLDEYLAWVRDVYRPALETAGVARLTVVLPIFGAPSGEVVLTRALDSLSEIDDGPALAKTLSPDQIRALNAQSAPFVLSSRTRILRLRDDLSYRRPGGVQP